MNQHSTTEEAVFSVGDAPRLYNDELLAARIRIEGVSGVGRTMAIKELSCAKKSS
jgi:hypothetical protein